MSDIDQRLLRVAIVLADERVIEEYDLEGIADQRQEEDGDGVTDYLSWNEERRSTSIR